MLKGSPRNLAEIFQDGMAVVRSLGRPDLFVTVTCNPLWPEITNEIKNVENSQKLTIICRIFRIKLNAILDDIFKKQIFGKVKASMYVIEFQKRGLPHAHILIILEDDNKFNSAEDYDSVISAEIPDPILHPNLYATVTKTMVHGPCGILNPGAACMVNNVCSKHFPKEFCEVTQENEDGYPEYMRSDNGRTIKRESKNKIVEIDNRWIVPYNPYLTTKYNCHINVEICSSVSFS